MPRDYRASENTRKAKAKRQQALERNELRGPSTPHVSAAGATSAPIKAPDPDDALLIAAFLEAKNRLGEQQETPDPPRPSSFGPGGMIANLAARQEITPKCESPIEIDLGAALIQHADGRYETSPQYSVGRYRFDFGLLAGGRLIALVECDGAEFHSSPAQKTNDAAKDAAAAAAGVPIFRATGKAIYRDPQDQAKRILYALGMEPLPS